MNINALIVLIGLVFPSFISDSSACPHKPQAWCCAVQMDENVFCKQYKKCDLNDYFNYIGWLKLAQSMMIEFWRLPTLRSIFIQNSCVHIAILWYVASSYLSYLISYHHHVRKN